MQGVKVQSMRKTEIIKHWACVFLPQVPSQCVESQSFNTPPVYSPGKQCTKTKTCSISATLTELDHFEKVIIPKRTRSSKKIPDGATGRRGNTSTLIARPAFSIPTEVFHRWYLRCVTSSLHSINFIKNKYWLVKLLARSFNCKNDDRINTHTLDFPPQQSSWRENFQSWSAISVTKSFRKTLTFSSTSEGELECVISRLYPSKNKHCTQKKATQFPHSNDPFLSTVTQERNRFSASSVVELSPRSPTWRNTCRHTRLENVFHNTHFSFVFTKVSTIWMKL